jgi:hypothetical protein
MRDSTLLYRTFTIDLWRIVEQLVNLYWIPRYTSPP